MHPRNIFHETLSCNYDFATALAYVCDGKEHLLTSDNFRLYCCHISMSQKNWRCSHLDPVFRSQVLLEVNKSGCKLFNFHE